MLSRGSSSFQVRFLLLALAGCADTNHDRIEARLTWQQPPGSETVNCHHLKLDNDQPFDVGRFTVDFPFGSHHVHLYRSDLPEPDGVVPCSTGIDWMRWRLLLAVQRESLDWILPEGVATRIDAHQQLMMQVHWINATHDPETPTISIGLARSRHASVELGTLLAVSQDVAMAPGEAKTVGSWVTPPEGAQLLRAMGHYHDRGTRFSLHRATPDPIYQSVGPDAFSFASLDDQPLIARGEVLHYRCDFQNDTDAPISWGADTKTQEHCNLALYYFPGGPTPSQVLLSGGVKSLLLPSLASLNGEPLQAGVVLTRAAGLAGTDVYLTSLDPSRLQAPARVHVPAGSDRVDFVLTPLGAGRARLTATTGAEPVEATIELR